MKRYQGGIVRIHVVQDTDLELVDDRYTGGKFVIDSEYLLHSQNKENG